VQRQGGEVVGGPAGRHGQVRESWSYTEAMPLLPPLGTGLIPFLQWLIVPGIAFGCARRKARVSNLIST